MLDWLKLLVAEDIPPVALRSQYSKQVFPSLNCALMKKEHDVYLFERLIFMARHNRLLPSQDGRGWRCLHSR